MRSRLLAVALLLLVAGCSQQPHPDLSPEVSQEALPFAAAVWTYTDLVGQAKVRSSFYNFASTHPINNIYLEAEYSLQYQPDQLTRFLQEAQSRKFKVELLSGHAQWALSTFHVKALAHAQRAVDLVNTSPQLQGTALHLDVEPYLLPEWSTQTQEVASQYLDLLEKVKALLGTKMALTVDIPCWFDEIPVLRSGTTRPLSEWIIQTADTTVLMDYRDTTQGIINSGLPEIEFAGKVGKKVVLGVNTKNENGLSPASTTFYEEGTRQMEKTLSQVNTTLSAKPGYGGMAVFTYEDYSRLRK